MWSPAKHFVLSLALTRDYLTPLAGGEVAEIGNKCFADLGLGVSRCARRATAVCGLLPEEPNSLMRLGRAAADGGGCLSTTRCGLWSQALHSMPAPPGREAARDTLLWRWCDDPARVGDAPASLVQDHEQGSPVGCVERLVPDLKRHPQKVLALWRHVSQGLAHRASRDGALDGGEGANEELRGDIAALGK